MFGGRVAKAPVKSPERSLEKIVKDYDGDADRIKDMIRNTIIVPSDKIPDVVAALERRGAKVKVISPEADPYGYSGVNSSMVLSIGLTGEIQVNSPEMIFAKEPEAIARAVLGDDVWEGLNARFPGEGGKGHHFYEQGRSAPAGTDLSGLQAQSQAYYWQFRNAVTTSDNTSFVQVNNNTWNQGTTVVRRGSIASTAVKALP